MIPVPSATAPATRKATPTSLGAKPARPAASNRIPASILTARALQNLSGRSEERVGALLARQPRLLDDAVERHFRGAAEDRENGLVSRMVDGVVAPLAVGDLAAVDVQNLVEFLTIEADRRSAVSSVAAARAMVPPGRRTALCLPSRSWFLPRHPAVMIAPFCEQGKSAECGDLPPGAARRTAL